MEKNRLLSGGRVQHCCSMKIFDDDDNELPLREVGEICAQGPNIMVGYWNKPELTAETLRGGWLHTGDMGYMDEDGYVYIVDRKKDMIISGGENIYSSEVEAAFYRSPLVLECAVIGIPDERWGEAVHAFIVPSSTAAGVTEIELQLMEVAREHLAAYKVPKGVTIIKELPKAATGKIQKVALRDKYWSGKSRRVGASGDN
jgi:long-chain acyl-CoA synthetase